MRLRRYPHEWLVLALVALAALPIVNPPNTQDASRLALTNSILLRGAVDIDPYRHLTGDRSYYRGHWYTDKAPGVSLAVLPPVAALRLVDRARGADRDFPVWLRETHLWLIRLWSGGIPFLALVFLVGRVAEGLAPRTGAATAVTFGLGTMLGSLAPTTFGHRRRRSSSSAPSSSPPAPRRRGHGRRSVSWRGSQCCSSTRPRSPRCSSPPTPPGAPASARSA